MKIAIPVKLNNANPPVAPLFGKAKWFAFVENGKTEIKANPGQGGYAVIEWLIQEGVDTIIMQEMGVSPYQLLQSYGGMKLYHSGFERILLQDLLEKYENNEVELLDDSNMRKIITHHEQRHPRHHHEGNHHGHRHHH